MRKSVSILLLLLVTQLLIADTNSFFAPYPSSFNVNLADTITYSGVPDDLRYTGGFAPGYSEQTMIALLGFSGLNAAAGHKIELTIEVVDPAAFEYVSASEPYLSRPFELDVVKSQSTSSFKSFVKFDEGDNSKKTATISVDADEIWFDFVLELPASGMENALAKNDYYVQLEISAKEYYDKDENEVCDEGELVSKHGPWPFYISGYIDEGSPANVSYVMMNITPTARANAISIDQLAKGESMHIANYFYESMAFMPGSQTNIYDEDRLSYDEQFNNPLYVFASSSSNPNDTSARDFEMKMAGLENEENLSSAYSFPFTIEMRNVNYNEKKPGVNSKTFYGKNPSSVNDMLSGSEIKGTLGGTHGTSDNKNVLYFYDDGSIYIQVPEANRVALDDLTAGVYTSTIYIHVVSAS